VALTLATPFLAHRSQPEGGDSYAAVNVIPVAEGEIYPVFRSFGA
jgi:hypothetical protein